MRIIKLIYKQMNKLLSNEALKTAFRSFLVRAGVILVVAFLNFLLQSLDLFGLSPSMVVIIGGLLGVILKDLDEKIVSMRLGSTNAAPTRFIF